MLYHYTDRLSAAEIVRDGVIRATPITLHRDLLGRDAGYETTPIVWLSTDAIMEPTVASKLMFAGWPREDVRRFVFRDDFPAVMLAQYSAAAGIDPHWWEMSVRTAAMIGSHHRTWRLCERDILAGEWLRVESPRESDDGELCWT